MSSLQTVTDLMEIAARTAPKSAGQDFVVVKVIEGDDLKRLGDEMTKYGAKVNKKNFDRDGRSVAANSLRRWTPSSVALTPSSISCMI